MLTVDYGGFSNNGDGTENVQKDNNRLNNQNNNKARALHFLVHFFAIREHDKDMKFNFLKGSFMEDVNARRRIFLFLSKLGCGLQEFNSRKFHQHIALKTT